ncbi:MAG: DNA polymerase III subunit gamma/tau [Chloroflexi bacterium]|nr:DNA polymerase III subunit gamma/tau [Chloroflexota bacterium]
MTTQALYNKWRGQSFADILGQEHITTTLRNQVRMGRVGHAYLFVGLRGTGKTSTARILAKAVNCVGQTDDPPCNKCHICLSLTEGRSTDLIEIDAASNRGIDEIRDLREGVAFLPSECRYKVYVIDEVHMLTKEAFNALLKTLEEPPPRVIFILCTTEVQSLPATVLSRCQRFDFRRGSLDTITQKLQMICDQEGIRITPDALDYIARRATGSYRDAESLLDQLAAFGDQEITLPQIKAMLGSAPTQQIHSLVGAIIGRDLAAGLRTINQMLDQGADPREITTAVIDQLRAVAFLVAGTEDDLSLAQEDIQELREIIRHTPSALRVAVNAIRLFNEAAAGIKGAARPHIPLELAFIETCLGESEPKAREQPAAAIAPAQHTFAAPAPILQVKEEKATPVLETGLHTDIVPPQSVAVSAEKHDTAAAPTAKPGDAIGTVSLELIQQKWSQILVRVRELNPQVRALLSSARPVAVQQNTVVLGCQAVFHRDKLMEAGKRDVVEQVLCETLGQSLTLRCELGQAENTASRPQTSVSEARTPDPREAERQRLRNHPAVQELIKRGGKVTDIRLNDDKEGKD